MFNNPQQNDHKAAFIYLFSSMMQFCKGIPQGLGRGSGNMKLGGTSKNTIQWYFPGMCQVYWSLWTFTVNESSVRPAVGALTLESVKFSSGIFSVPLRKTNYRL